MTLVILMNQSLERLMSRDIWAKHLMLWEDIHEVSHIIQAEQNELV